MADVKFIRVRGKVVPISSDRVAGQRKKVRESASDTVSQKDAVKSLRTSGRFDRKSGATATKAGVGLFSVGTVGLFGGLRLGRKVALAGGAVQALGLAAAGIGQAFGRRGKQKSRDAGRIAKGRELTRRASSLGSLYQSRLEGRYVPAAPLVASPVPPVTATKGTSD